MSSSGYKSEPIKREFDNSGVREEIRETHPCFGSAQLTRRSGAAVLFGSVVKGHAGYVVLTICRAERQHSYSKDTVYPREQLIEVSMSEAQFAELITTWNRGEGVPVTLNRIREGDFVSVPAIDTEEEAETERARALFKERMEVTARQFFEARDQLFEILDKKGAINKKDRDKIRDIFWRVNRWLVDEAPYATNTFVEATERAVQKAKTEVDAFVTRVIHKTGLDAIKSMRLPGSTEPLLLPGDEEGR